MKNSKRLLSVILAIAILVVSLPLSFAASAAVPNISDAEYPIGDVLWSFDAAEVAAVPSDWEASTPVGAWGDGSNTLAYDSSLQAVKFTAGGTDGVLQLPAIQGDANNFIYEIVVTPVGSSSFGPANNIVTSTSTDTDSDGNYDAAAATWMAFYNNSQAEEGYFIRKGATTLSRTKLDATYTRPASGAKCTIKMVVLNGNTYVYVNDTLMVLEDGSAEGFADPNTTENISIGMFATNITVNIHSMKVTEIAEPEEIKIWDGSFDGALPTADADGDGEIEITTPEEFAAVAKTNGLDANGNRIKYELTGDIWLNDTSVEGWKDNAPNLWLDPVKLEDVSESNTFYGIINGNGYVVRGVYVDATVEVTRNEFNATDDADYDSSLVLAEGSAPELDLYEDVYAGLFPVIGKGAGLVGIGLEDSYISVKDSSSPITLKEGNSTKAMNLIGSVGFVGVVANSGSNQAVIDQCYINNSVELIGGRTAMVGCGNKTNQFIVSNCYASATATMFTGTSASNAAGTGNQKWDNNSGNRFMLLSGNGAAPTVTSCYTYGNVCNNGVFIKTTAAGAAYNNVYFSSWANGDYATQINWNNIVGDTAKTLMPNLDWTKFETVSGGRPVLSVFKTHNLGTDGSVWNGGTDSDLETDSDGYKLITNASELRYAVTASGNFRLLNDIWVNDIEVYAQGAFYLADRAPKNWTDTGSFSGNFDGNGKVVRGLFFNTADATLTQDANHATGLIPSLASGGTVKRVGVEQTWFRNHCTGRMGAVVGTLNDGAGSVIDSCYAGESVYLYGCTKVGGITGGRDGSGAIRTINNCYSLATIKTDGGIWGGIVGDCWSANKLVVNNSYANVPYLVGQGNAITVGTGCYTTSADVGSSAVSAANMMGADALTNMADLNANDVYRTTLSYPVLKYFDPNYVEEEEVGEVWNGSIAAEFAGGTGTEADPYVISKGSQLAKAINEFGLSGSYFKLDRDIYLNDIENFANARNTWFTASLTSGKYYAYKGKVTESTITETLGAFNGHIDGDGHYIYGLAYTDNSSQAAGLLPIMAAGSIKNLGVDYVRLDANGGYTGEEGTSAGVLIGRSYQTGKITIDRCYVGANVTFIGGVRGGMIGYATGNTSANYVAISNSYVLIPESVLNSGKNSAFIADVWNTYYTLENCWSLARPVNPASNVNRASQFYKDDATKMGDYIKNVFSAADDLSGTYEVSGDIKLYTTLSDAQMRGTKVFSTMTVNGDDAFLFNIGYPTLKWQGNSVPSEDELLAGLINIATAMPMTEYKVDTQTFIISGQFATGKAVSIALDDANTTTFSVAADGTATLTSGEVTNTKALTLGATAEYKLAVVSGFVLAYVDGQFVGLVELEAVPGYTAAFTGFDLDTDTILVDLYINDYTFDSVEFGGVDLQLADRYGKNSGGVKLDITLNDEPYIDDMGYDVEYGWLVYVGNEVVDGITVDNAQAIEFNASTENFEIIGLGTAKQELFFALRGYAKVTVNEEIEHYYYGATEMIFSPIYEANKLYENETYAEAIKAVYSTSDKFVDNYGQDIEFALFADYHYKQGMYTSQLSDLKAIIETANTLNGGAGADFVFSLGDMSNDMVQSKEITNYLLDGTYSDAEGTTYNNHSYAFYNLYGNHELESSNRLTYVNQTLTNSEVHWGDGSVGTIAAITAQYADQTVENNDFEIRNELAKGSYYWFEKNGIRIIVTNTNFSWNPNHINGEVVGWEHNLIGSYGCPAAAINAERGFDEGTAALANTNTNNLGAAQLQWLEETLMDAVTQGTPCVIMGHDAYASNFGGSSSKNDVRALFKKANDIRPGTVIASFNGHLHTNRQQVIDDVLYLDINTVRNSWWQGGGTAHYTDEHTYSYDDYDEYGNYISTTTKSLNTLGQANNTWFANDPVHCSIKITQSGTVEITGMDSSWAYDVVPSQAPDYAQPGITSGSWTVGDATFTAAE